MHTTPGKQIKLLVLLVAIAALVYFAHPSPPGLVLGGWFVLIGLLIRIWAAGHLGPDNKLTTSGPYEFSRNPYYVGAFIIVVGLAVMSGLSNRAAQIVLIVALIFVYGFYLPRADRLAHERLADVAGENYKNWRSNVPMLIPRLTPYRMYPKGWSRDLFTGGNDSHILNKEWYATIAVLLTVGLLFLRMVKFQTVAPPLAKTRKTSTQGIQ